jgi:kinesin family protein 5
LHILVQVQVKRSFTGREDALSSEIDNSSHLVKPSKPIVRKSKLVLVDLAGSERVHKSGAYQKMLLFLYIHWNISVDIYEVECGF